MTAQLTRDDPDRSGDEQPVVIGCPGITHVAVTVSDLERSTRWYSALFGSRPVLDEPTSGFHHTVFALTTGQLFGLHKHAFVPDGGFDECRPGMDHVAFNCRDRAELLVWAERLQQLDIHHGGILDTHYGSGLSFRDPDGIAGVLCPARPVSPFTVLAEATPWASPP